MSADRRLAPPSGPSPFDARLGEHLRSEAGRYVMQVSAADVEAARGRHREARRAGIGRLVAATMVAAALVAGVTGVAASIASSRGQTAAVSSASPRPSRSSPTFGTRPSAPIGLADCQIEPADSSLAYAGWATLDVLHVQGGAAAPGAPVYAVVTRGLAEWVGWRDSGGAMYPPPIGRMGCVFDPSTRVTSIVGIPMDWQPPATAEGCPLSAVSQTGGYREVGGPNGWLVMPADAAAWYVGGDYRYLLSFRLSPPPNPGQSVAAWAQPIDGGQAIPGEVAMNTRLERPAVAIAQSAQASGFYVTNLGFPRAGCWVVDMAINGDVVGSAVLAVGGRNPSPRPIPILP